MKSSRWLLLVLAFAVYHVALNYGEVTVSAGSASILIAALRPGGTLVSILPVPVEAEHQVIAPISVEVANG